MMTNQAIVVNKVIPGKLNNKTLMINKAIPVIMTKKARIVNKEIQDNDIMRELISIHHHHQLHNGVDNNLVKAEGNEESLNLNM
jgi:hypothetical protein